MFTKLTKQDIPWMQKMVEDSGSPVPSKEWLERLFENGSKGYKIRNVAYYMYDPRFKGDKNGVELDIIEVTKKERGKGLGKQMMEHCVEQTKKEEKTKMYFFVRRNNQEGIAFYNSLGAYVAGALYDRYGKGKHALIMCKEI